MIPTDVEVKAAYKKATEDQRWYINSDELFNTFYTLRTKYNLHVDVAGNLVLLINAVILEIVPLTEFPAQLKSILTGSSEADYQAVLKAVNEEIFVAFRKRVKERAEAKAQEAKELAEKKKREDAEDQALELELKKQFESSTPAGAIEKATTTVQSQTPPVPPAVPVPAKSVIEQKTTVTSAPIQQQATIPPPAQKTQTPPKYHGTDPYREMPE